MSFQNRHSAPYRLFDRPPPDVPCASVHEDDATTEQCDSSRCQIEALEGACELCACAACGYGAFSNSQMDCITCEDDGFEVVVLYESCTGVRDSEALDNSRRRRGHDAFSRGDAAHDASA